MLLVIQLVTYIEVTFNFFVFIGLRVKILIVKNCGRALKGGKTGFEVDKPFCVLTTGAVDKLRNAAMGGKSQKINQLQPGLDIDLLLFCNSRYCHHLCGCPLGPVNIAGIGNGNNARTIQSGVHGSISSTGPVDQHRLRNIVILCMTTRFQGLLVYRCIVWRQMYSFVFTKAL